MYKLLNVCIKISNSYINEDSVTENNAILIITVFSTFKNDVLLKVKLT